MAWLEIHITTSATQTDFLGDQLTELGAQAITLLDAGGQPIYEPAPGEIPSWQKTILIALFDDQHEISSVKNFLDIQKNNNSLEEFHFKKLADQPWERVCLQDFKPVRFGKRLWICPSWDTPPEPNAVNVILDPGLAFGTGSSPTTALCLEWLDTNIQPNTTVIDYGCGSGILALAALKLGAKKVFAIDYDPQALIATRDNGERNQFGPPQLVTLAPEEFTAEAVDVVIANILAKSLIELAPYLSSLVKEKGQILLSGILAEQVKGVIDIYSQWFEMKAPTSLDGWVRLEGTKR